MVNHCTSSVLNLDVSGSLQVWVGAPLLCLDNFLYFPTTVLFTEHWNCLDHHPSFSTDSNLCKGRENVHLRNLISRTWHRVWNIIGIPKYLLTHWLNDPLPNASHTCCWESLLLLASSFDSIHHTPRCVSLADLSQDSLNSTQEAHFQQTCWEENNALVESSPELYDKSPMCFSVSCLLP